MKCSSISLYFVVTIEGLSETDIPFSPIQIEIITNFILLNIYITVGEVDITYKCIEGNGESVNISKLNHTFLNRQNAISLQHQTSHKSESVQNVEEQMKDRLKEQPIQTVGNGTSINPADIKVTVQGEMAHFDFVKDIEGLSAEEKQQISQLIQHSVKKPAGGTSDYFVMDRAQTTAQLQLIADKLIPEKYKDQMYEAIKNYQKEGMDLQVRMYEAGQEIMDQLSASYPSLGKSSILTEGMKTLQEQEAWTSTLYGGLDDSNQSTFVQSFEAILANFKENQLQLKNSSEEVLNRYQDELRSKWNDFATLFNDATVYKLPTNHNSVIDVRL